MNDKTSFKEKFNSFIYGKPVSTLNEADLELIRGFDQKLDTLLNQLNLFNEQQNETAQESLADLTDQVRKLAKTQFKTNTLQESQLAQQEETLATLRDTVTQRDNHLTDLSQQQDQALEAAQLDWLKQLLPVLDGLDAAFDTGRRQVLQLPMNPEVRKAIIAWLDGIRLARMRLLDLLAAYNVAPIPAVGQPFNRCNFRAVHLRRQNHARIHSLTVKKHDTGTTVAGTATIFGASESKVGA